MGSKSSQNQQTSSSNTQQSFVDNSENYNDYSDNSEYYHDSSQVTDINQDFSDNSSTDITMEGIGAGANVGGNIVVTDGGAFDTVDGAILAVRDSVSDVLKAGVEQSYMANELSREAIGSNERVTRDALITAENTSKAAISGIAGVASDSIYEMRQNSRDVIDGSLQMTAITADTIRGAGQDLAESSQRTTQQAIEASNAAMERNAALIQTTALGGQDLMIDMVKKILMGFVVSLGVAGVSYAVFGGKK